MRPATSAYTDRLFDALPELYRAADEDTDGGLNDWPLLRYLSLVGDQANELQALVDRILLHLNGDGVWLSELADPARADDGWLLWLAQFASLQAPEQGSTNSYAQLVIDFPTYADLLAALGTYGDVRHYGELPPLSAAALRAMLIAAADPARARVTSSQEWDERLKPLLTGTQTLNHNRIFGGDPWHLHFTTLAAETPQPAAVAAVIAQTRKAAGLLVTHATI